MQWDFTREGDREFLGGAIHEALYNLETGITPECSALQLAAICAAAEETLMRFNAQAPQDRRKP